MIGLVLLPRPSATTVALVTTAAPDIVDAS